MAYSDVLSGQINALLEPKIDTTEGGKIGERIASHKMVVRLTDGAGSGAATGFFSSTFTATTGGITISMADSADPLGAAGDDAPTMDPEGLKLKALLIENKDSTNFVRFTPGTNADTNVMTGNTDSINITAGGFILWYSPAGVSAMNDGSDDEIKITADTASCSVKITYLFG